MSRRSPTSLAVTGIPGEDASCNWEKAAKHLKWEGGPTIIHHMVLSVHLLGTFAAGCGGRDSSTRGIYPRNLPGRAAWVKQDARRKADRFRRGPDERLFTRLTAPRNAFIGELNS